MGRGEGSRVSRSKYPVPPFVRKTKGRCSPSPTLPLSPVRYGGQLEERPTLLLAMLCAATGTDVRLPWRLPRCPVAWSCRETGVGCKVRMDVPVLRNVVLQVVVPGAAC